MIGTSTACRRLLAKHLSRSVPLFRALPAVQPLSARSFSSVDAKSNVSQGLRRKDPKKAFNEASVGATASFSSASAAEEALTDVQKTHWKSYLATGRGAVSLFESIDKDNDGKLNVTDVHFFLLHAIQDDHPEAVLPKAFRILDERAEDHPIDLHEFKDWLVQSTQEHGYVSVQPAYERSKIIGERSPKNKPDDFLHAWNKTTMNQGLRRMQYAVRGDVVMRADELAAEGREIIFTNIGNPHSVGQHPITFYRQVLALCDLPSECGVDHPNAVQMFPADVLERARELRQMVGPSGTGSYTNSQGLPGIRQQVAEYIAKRDGIPAYPGDIYLTNGASAGIEMILNALISQDHDAIMIPIPQYPIYSALITRLGGRKIGYELDEDIGWAVTRAELDKRLDEAKASGLTVKGLAMINP